MLVGGFLFILVKSQIGIIQTQIGITVVVAVIAFVAGFSALSALLGGGVAVCGTSYAVYANHRRSALGQQSAAGPAVWRTMVAIEIQKMVLIAALCALVFVLYPSVSPLLFFVAMLATAAAYLFYMGASA